MMDHEKVNILLVDDQPAKLLAYEVILKELGENLVVASSGREAAGERTAPQPRDRRGQDGIVGLGLGQWRLDVGRRSIPDLRTGPQKLRGDTVKRPGAATSRRY